MPSLISIIVPVYQSEKTLDRCLESIIRQTYSNIEVILVNDGSNDTSGEICDIYALKDTRIKVIHKNNMGVSSARNTGLKEAKGSYIQFVDSDDWLNKDSCEIMVKEITEQNVDMLICGLNITKNGKLLRTPHLPRAHVKPSIYFKDFKYIYSVFASPCNKIYKKELVGYFNHQISAGEDLLFNLEYIKNTNVVGCIEDCLYNVSLDNENSLNRKFKENELDLLLYIENIKRDFCISQYGENFNQSFIDNSIVLATHGYFRKIVKLKKKSFSLSIIEKYSGKETVIKAAENASFGNSDKGLFNYLLKKKRINAIYLFLLIKVKLR
ncbi:glycosyltransferase family 2 protein [Planococcus donghaensis]|uniref:glycosyltransferase family 2 protein n=1 Tax=Planococcus donghaensis TaxID=414778 RepID=UPI003735B90E